MVPPFFFDISLLYLAHGCFITRRCIAYNPDPDTTLNFDINLKFIRYLTCFRVRPINYFYYAAEIEDFYPVTLTLEFDPFFEIIKLANNFWTVSARALKFYMSIASGKDFSWVPFIFTLWPWLWSLTYFWKI